MKGTWRKTRNGWVVVDQHGDEWVAGNVLDLMEIFEGMGLEERVLNGEPGAPEPLGLLTLMRGSDVPAPEQLVTMDRDEQETWEPIEAMEGGAFDDRERRAQESVDWPSSPAAATESGASYAPENETPAPSAEPEYVPATEDGYEFPAVRGPLNGKREIKCPTHGWQLAVVKDGAYRCQFKPSPRQVCSQPGTPKAEAEKRLVAS